MKHVNGDMEDLFRRAAAKYPLRTDSADWDRLSAALDKDPGPPSDTDKDDKRRRRGIFWWWLLLPLAVGAGVYSWHVAVRPSAHLSKAATQAGKPQGTMAQPGVTQGGTPTQAGGPAAGETQSAGTQTQPGETEKAGAGSEAGPAGGTGSTGTGVTGLAGSTARGTQSAAGTRLTATGKTGSTATASGGIRLTGSSTDRTQPTGATAKAGSTSGGNVTSDDLFDAADKNITGKKAGYGNSAANEAMTSRLNLQRAQTAGSFSLVVDVRAPAARKDSSAKKATAKSKGGHGYIGLTGAPDLSTVKMQATKGVGTTWGLLLGYAFNSHWAVESGVYLDQKKYYTAGEYFKGETQPYMNLQSVNGSCNMWEIPLNVRYNFNPGSKITWFATTGVSSYFMTKQEYYYQYEGVPQATDWSTKVPANYLFSIINLSGGFEQRIGKIGNLRIEPYVRLPLSGIGTGHLPIMSAGLNIGITRQLW